MRQLLEAEGIVFSDERVDLKRYGWDPSRDLSAEELKRVLDDADGRQGGAKPVGRQAGDRLIQYVGWNHHRRSVSGSISRTRSPGVTPQARSAR